MRKSRTLLLSAFVCLWPLGIFAKAKARKFHVSGPQDVERLIKSIQFGDPEERERAMERLADPDPKAKKNLEAAYLQLLDDPDSTLRSSAALACSKLGLLGAIVKLRAILASVPKTAIHSETEMDDPTNDERSLTYPIAQALVELNDVESVKEILSRDALSSNWDVLLPRFGAKALPLLVARAAGSGPARSGALRAIAAIEDESAAAELQTLLKDSDAGIRTSAAAALTGISRK